MPRRTRQIIVFIVGLCGLYFLLSSFNPPRARHRTEASSPKLQLQREIELNQNWKLSGLNFRPNKINRLPDDTTMRSQLSFTFPYEPHKPFPKNIWQTWKVGLDDKTFPKRFQYYQESWDEQNPGYKHYVVPDAEANEMIASLYKTVPDVARAYSIMPKSILQADFFRYLILYARGGVYSDIDTWGLKPVSTWVSANDTLNNKPSNPGVVVGIEADPDRPDWNDWYARRIQFCQWTIQAKPGHPLLRELIARITELTLERDANGKLSETLGKDESGDIMDWTGPGIFTDYVFKYLNNILQPSANFESKNYEKVIDWEFFTGIQSPMLIDDVMVLPITSFSPDVGQMGAGSSHDALAYVKHMFQGSWKTDGTGEQI
ncbi:initiation-specific alpha-1,6-mannosyltransferase [Diutina rugosa]